MKPLAWRLSLAFLLLSGCANYQGPRQSHEKFPDTSVPSSNSENNRVIASNRVHNEPTPSRDTPYEPNPNEDPRHNPPPTYNRPRPASAAPAANRAVSGALSSLVSQAQSAYQAGNYQSAIATAERGLRIDRRAPALYLVLAQSYLALNQPSQAAQFANQGLRFSLSGSPEARELEKVRNGAGG